MRIFALALCSALLATAAVAAPPKAGTFFDYVPDKNAKPLTYAIDGVSIRIVKLVDKDYPEMISPIYTISAKGMKPITVKGEPTMTHYGHSIAVGRLNKADKVASVILQNYSGGAHCCTSVTAVVPVGGAFQTVSLGGWDGEGLDAFPKDISGDGVADFQFLDNAFLYAFGSYADSWAPLLFMNVVSGKSVDVSSNPAFRKAYEADMAEARQQCIAPKDAGTYRNGACAAYGASAARLGKYPAARAEIVRHHQANSDWDYPTGCAVAETDTGCPDGQVVNYGSFPAALDAFLKQQGYLSAR